MEGLSGYPRPGSSLQSHHYRVLGSRQVSRPQFSRRVGNDGRGDGRRVARGFGPGRPITIPAQPNIGDWEKFEEARKALGPISLASIPRHATGSVPNPIESVIYARFYAGVDPRQESGTKRSRA